MKKSLLIGVLLLPLGCASVGRNEADPVQLRLAALEAEAQAMRDGMAEQERMLSGLGAVGLGSSVASLEQQLRTLRGQVEELKFSLGQQNDRQRALYVDLDSRLQALESGQAASQAKTENSGGSNPDQKVYLEAFQLLKAGSYDKATAEFEAFLQKYPDSAYAPNAQYWAGEAYYVQRKFEPAWSAFAKVLERFPTSSKAPDAMLKQALLRVEQGKTDEARERLNETIARFPSSSAASLAKEKLAGLAGK